MRFNKHYAKASFFVSIRPYPSKKTKILKFAERLIEELKLQSICFKSIDRHVGGRSHFRKKFIIAEAVAQIHCGEMFVTEPCQLIGTTRTSFVLE